MTSTPSTSGPVGVGIIGAGVVSEQYLTHLTSFPDVAVLAIGDLFPEAAEKRAEEYGIALHGGPDVVLEHPDIEIVVNLTVPTAHFDVSRQIIEAGKHVWTEKPITTASEDAAALLALAAERGLRVGGAPDTVLGAKAREQRTIGSGPKAGEVFDVTVPTQVTAILRFESGQHATSLLSFDNPNSRAGFVEVYGTEATLAFPDPNVFDGDSQLTLHRAQESTPVTAEGPLTGRGLGVLEMARAIRAGVPHRGQGEIAAHVLDVMLAIEASIASGQTETVSSTFTPVEPLPADYDPFAATL